MVLTHLLLKEVVLQLPSSKGQDGADPSFAFLYYLQCFKATDSLYTPGKIVNHILLTSVLMWFLQPFSYIVSFLNLKIIRNISALFLNVLLFHGSLFLFTVVFELPAAPYTDSGHLSCGLTPCVWLLPNATRQKLWYHQAGNNGW